MAGSVRIDESRSGAGFYGPAHGGYVSTFHEWWFKLECSRCGRLRGAEHWLCVGRIALSVGSSCLRNLRVAKSYTPRLSPPRYTNTSEPTRCNRTRGEYVSWMSKQNASQRFVPWRTNKPSANGSNVSGF